MLGISDDHIIEHHRGDEYYPDELDDESVLLSYNHTDPTVIRDGVDRVAVTEIDDSYRVQYWGYSVGEMLVIRDGIAELGEELLGGRDPIPRWLLDGDSIDEEDIPWWIPDEITLSPRVECDRCGDITPANSILTPNPRDEDGSDQFCRDCWEEIGEDYSP